MPQDFSRSEGGIEIVMQRLVIGNGHRFCTHQRAVHPMKTSHASVDQIAAEVGYAEGVTLRALLRWRLVTAPAKSAATSEVGSPASAHAPTRRCGSK